MGYRPSKIISGGQTGADMGGLLAAKDLGIRTGGWMPKGWLTELCELQGWKCAYCRRPMKKTRKGVVTPSTATLDHALPISRGGRNQRSNLVAACSSCNGAKGSMTAEEFNASRAHLSYGEPG